MEYSKKIINSLKRLGEGNKILDIDRDLFLPFYPLLRLFGQANSMKEIALSQLTLTRDGYEQFAINPKDIVKLAERF